MNNYAKLNLQIPGATTFPISKTLQSFLNLAWLFGERDISDISYQHRMVSIRFGPCPSSKNGHLAKLNVSHGGPAWPPITLRDQIKRFHRSSLNMFPWWLSIARSMDMGMTSLPHVIHCAKSA